VVSPDLPLRANLTVLDNIALIPQYRHNLKYDAAADMAWNLLSTAGYHSIADQRDPSLSHAERCVAKLLRAAIGRPPVILIDRPSMLLPEVDYPPFLFALLDTLANELNNCWIIDYQWNRALYDARFDYPEMSDLTT
jgi:ABC-type lipoprotein export system ATPase subunit